MLVEAGAGQAAFQVVIGLALLIFLYADAQLKRRVFTWYGCKRIIPVCWSITGLLTFVLGSLMLIPLTALILGEPATLMNPVSLLLIGVAILIIGAGVWAFVHTDRHYNRCCPKCNTSVPGDFDKLGKHCPECGEVFHPWLIARY